MASGNLSPRQKMINMMYLVLMAMLALNVAAEILQAFESLRHSLENSSANFTESNKDMAFLLKSHIREEIQQENRSHENLLPLIDEVQNEATQLNGYLIKLIDDLEILGQKDPETGEIIAKDEKDKNHNFWMGNDDLANKGRGKGEAAKLKDELRSYIAWANEFKHSWDPDSLDAASRFHEIALEPADDPSVNDAQARRKTWEFFTFGDKPLIADLAMLEKYKMDVRQVEAELLGIIKERTKPSFTVNKVMAVSSPLAEVVPAGGFFESRLYVAVSSDEIKPEFMGAGINVAPDGNSATLKIAASASAIPKGQSRGTQSYKRMIKVPMADGTYEELEVSGQFSVLRPEVIMRSETVNNLYRKCGNTVVADVPSLGDNYNPDFSASTGGNVIKSAANPKKITIVPSARKFVLDVKSKSNGQTIAIDQIKYNVIEPPLPRLVLMDGRNEYNGIKAISKKGKVRLKLKPDADFARNLPRDARYKVGKITLMLKDGLTPQTIATIDCSRKNIMEGVTVNLYKGAIKNASKGATIYLEVDKVERVNFRNETIDLNLARGEKLISASIK